MPKRSLMEMSLDELARLGEKAEVGSVDHGRMMAELARRQTIAQIEASRRKRRLLKRRRRRPKQPWKQRSIQSGVPTICSGR